MGVKISVNHWAPSSLSVQPLEDVAIAPISVSFGKSSSAGSGPAARTNVGGTDIWKVKHI